MWEPFEISEPEVEVEVEVESNLWSMWEGSVSVPRISRYANCEKGEKHRDNR